MEKIYRVQMNSKGMPNFSTAKEIPSVNMPIQEKCCFCPHCENCDVNDDLTIADGSQEWIPCSERLPSKGIAVLVNGIMYDAPPITISTDAPYYYEQGWINAWMPLPEPWEGADDE